MKIKILVIAVVLSVSMVLSGCGLITRFLPEDLEGILDEFFSESDDNDFNGNDKTESTDDTDYTENGGEQPPSSDSEGKDIDSVPRYPGSVRTKHSELFNMTSVEYVAQGAGFEDIREFYVDELENNGWNINVNFIISGDSVTIQASSPDGDELITIAVTESRYEDSLKIELILMEGE